jgi:hypothetical protein
MPVEALLASVTPTMPLVVGLNVTLVAVAAPMLGVVSVGDVAKTREPPEPVLVVIALNRLADDAVPSQVETPVPRPVKADCAYPVQELKTPDVGVSNAGVVRLGDVAKTREPPDPVFVVIALNRLADDGVPSHVETPVPRPVKADCAYPVHELKTPDVGVSNAGVVRLGDVANTREPPEPVLVVIALNRLADEGVPSHVEMPEPRPVSDDCAYPLHELKTPDAGVPSAGVTRAGDVAHTIAPVPVPPSVTAARRLAEEGVPSHVETLAPSPVNADWAYPVHELSTPAVGVPRAGVVKLGEVANTSEPPVPDLSDMAE